MGLIGKLKAKGEKYVAGKIVAIALTKIAEGDFGDKPKAAYWWLKGKKTYIGAAFGIAWAVLDRLDAAGICKAQGWDCAGWSNALLAASAFMLSIGFVDGALHAPAPKAPDQVNPASLPKALVLLALVPFLSGCGSAMAQVGLNVKPEPVKSETVLTRVCNGDDAGALEYLSLRSLGLSDSAKIDYFERAKADVMRGKCPCPGKACSK